ncbi:MAG: hypothetical protein AAF526_05055 [Pseudomonadota bacterium]
MQNITGKWKAEWERKKKFFEAETGKKKPSTKFLGFFRKGSGVTKAFAIMDAAYANMMKKQMSPDRVKAQNMFEKAIAQAKKTGAAYAKLLDQELAKEGNDNKKVPLKKSIAPLLKILKDDIDLCITSAEGQLEASRGLNGEGGRADPSKVMEMKQFTARLPTSLKAAAMWAKVQDQNPNVAAFNEGIQKATRDISQNLNNICQRLRRGSPEARKAQKLLDLLLPWANGGKRLNADRDTFAEVVRELTTLKKIVAAISTWNKGMKVEKIVDDLI